LSDEPAHKAKDEFVNTVE
jgi:hypothetical protein